jgi:HEAT repeat protein
LGRVDPEGAAEVLVEVVREDDYAFVREAAARALASSSSPEARSVLAEVAEEDPEPRVRAAAAGR